MVEIVFFWKTYNYPKQQLLKDQMDYRAKETNKMWILFPSMRSYIILHPPLPLPQLSYKLMAFSHVFLIPYLEYY
jgi:hypothetical protein